MNEPIGADIESICRKCGDVWHVVVSKKDDTIAKVQCKQCGGTHRLKRPDGSTGSSKTKAAGKTRKARAPKAPPGPKVEAKPGLAPRSYHPREKFEPGDTINHPTFGQGVVQEVQGTKMTVHFPEGERKLAQGR